MCRQILEIVMAALTLMCVLVPLDGAYIPTNSDVNISDTLGAGQDNTTSVNTSTTASGEFFTKFLFTAESEHEMSDGDSRHSRSRRWAEVRIDALQRSSENLNERSVCPWIYRNNTDPKRRPSTVTEAQCTQHYVPGLAGQCEHVYAFVPIKQLVFGTWEKRWLWLRVGCTLAKPLSAPPITFD